MTTKNYIFLTLEGHTYQPNSEVVEPDINNLQVIGFSIGVDQKDAFRRLLKENSYLVDTTFDEIFCLELADDFIKQKQYFHLSELSKRTEKNC